MYSEKVMDHFTNPRNMGEIENASGVGTVGNAKCGDIMRIYLDIDENQVIRECKFKTFGCGAAVATSSMATELVKGKTINEALAETTLYQLFSLLSAHKKQSQSPFLYLLNESQHTVAYLSRLLNNLLQNYIWLPSSSLQLPYENLRTCPVLVGS